MIKGINHYNLRSDEETMNALKDFYINIVGLKLGERPAFKSTGFWLSAEDECEGVAQDMNSRRDGLGAKSALRWW